MGTDCKSALSCLNGHTNHPAYDTAIEQEINKILNQYTPAQYKDAFEEIQDLINSTKSKLENEVLLGNKDVNQIIDL